MKKQNQNTETDQEKLSQKALGNTAVELNASSSDNELKSTPKTTGTGGNPASSTPNSLIVHEDEKGEHRYEDGDETK
ncbi:hypothetical protein [Pedobacter sp.]|uniref:hypothetical protein n=1 Tax=Pedobacter sp. TaxID=1411316 RepID=UPI003BAD8E10